jgi:hypothetical protein
MSAASGRAGLLLALLAIGAISGLRMDDVAGLMATMRGTSCGRPSDT